MPPKRTSFAVAAGLALKNNVSVVDYVSPPPPNDPIEDERELMSSLWEGKTIKKEDIDMDNVEDDMSTCDEENESEMETEGEGSDNDGNDKIIKKEKSEEEGVIMPKEEEILEESKETFKNDEIKETVPTVDEKDSLFYDCEIDEIAESLNEVFSSANWCLCADQREQQGFRLDLLEKAIENKNYTFATSTLPVGDFWWGKNGRIWAIIERKSVKDMIASIQDERYKDQANRMIASGCPFLYYLVVGDPFIRLTYLEQRMFSSAMLHLSMHSIKILSVGDDQAAIQLLVKMTEYLDDHPTTERICKPFVAPVVKQTKKKELGTAKDVFIYQLAVIPGVSVEKATRIWEFYPSMRDLFRAWDNALSETEREKLLEKIPCGGRSLGKALSKKIYLVMGKKY